MKYVLVTSLLILASCANRPTRTMYIPNTGNGGYSDATKDNLIKLANFSGNAYTKSDDAAIFAQLRMFEVCDENNMLPRMVSMDNLSKSKNVLNTSSSTYVAPTYYSGNSNTNVNGSAYNYGNGNSSLNAFDTTSSSGTAYGGSRTSNSQTWEETLNFPDYVVKFICSDKVSILGVDIKEVSADDMKPYVKDLLGGMQITKVMPDSPNQEILQVGDIVTKMNGRRIANKEDSAVQSHNFTHDDKVKLTLFREGKQMVVTAKQKDYTGFISDYRKKILSAACVVPEIASRPSCNSSRNPSSESGK